MKPRISKHTVDNRIKKLNVNLENSAYRWFMLCENARCQTYRIKETSCA